MLPFFIILTNIIKQIIKFKLKCRYYLFSFRKPYKIGFLRLYNEENTVIPCLMSVIDMFDKIVLIYSDIEDSSLTLVNNYIKENFLEDKIIISRYPHKVYTQNSPMYYKDFKYENSLAAYYEYGYNICRKFTKFRNGYIAKIDADQIYINNCFNEIEEIMKKEKYSIIVNSYGGYNCYVNGNKYVILYRKNLGYINGNERDHLCIPFEICRKVKFCMYINKDHAYELMFIPHRNHMYTIKQYDKIMWFHFNRKIQLAKGEMHPLSAEQYKEYTEKVYPILQKANSAYTKLKVITNE